MKKMSGFRRFRGHPMALLQYLLVHLAAILTGGTVLVLVGYILITGIPHLSLDLFAWEFTTENQSMMPAIINTLCMTILTLLMAVPVGVGAAIYLAEYAKRGNILVKMVRITAETLAGIPSIVYGLFGFMFFNVALGWGYSMLSGAVTLAIMVLPLVMRTTEEALNSVSDTFREGSFGLGAGKLPNCSACCCSGDSVRHYFEYRKNCRRVCGFDFHLWFRSGNPQLYDTGRIFSVCTAVSVYQNLVRPYVQPDE